MLCILIHLICQEASETSVKEISCSFRFSVLRGNLVAKCLTQRSLHICITQRKFGINDFSISVCLELCLFIIDRSCLTPWYLFILTCFPSCIYLPILPHSLLFALIFNLYLSSDLHLYLQPPSYNPVTKKPLQFSCLSSCLSHRSPPARSRRVRCLASAAPHLHRAMSPQRKRHQCCSCPSLSLMTGWCHCWSDVDSMGGGLWKLAGSLGSKPGSP